MSDSLPPDEAGVSKRERQKARRRQKLAVQAQEARKARRRRLVAFAALAVLLLGLIGAAGANYLNERAEEQAAREEAARSLAEFGCTEIIQLPNNGAGHFSPDQLTQSPPEVVYPDRPATSGIHINRWAMTGVYDKAIDERLLVHNLEHGYVVAWYSADAPAEDVEALKAYAGEQIDDDFEKLVVAEYPGELPEGNFALVSWDFRQTCEQFSDSIAFNFLDLHHGLDSTGPENTLAPHLDATGGTIDPNEVDGDLLFPPLEGGDAPAIETEAPTEDGTAGDAATDASTDPAATEPGGATEPEATAAPSPTATDS